MNTTKAFLRKLAAEWGEPGKPLSDYALAARIGVTKQQMSKYQSGEDYPGEEVAIRIADALDLDHGYVLACIAAERSKSEQAKKAWLSLTARLPS